MLPSLETALGCGRLAAYCSLRVPKRDFIDMYTGAWTLRVSENSRSLGKAIVLFDKVLIQRLTGLHERAYKSMEVGQVTFLVVLSPGSVWWGTERSCIT